MSDLAPGLPGWSTASSSAPCLECGAPTFERSSGGQPWHRACCTLANFAKRHPWGGVAPRPATTEPPRDRHEPRRVDADEDLAERLAIEADHESGAAELEMADVERERMRGGA